MKRNMRERDWKTKERCELVVTFWLGAAHEFPRIHASHAVTRLSDLTIGIYKLAGGKCEAFVQVGRTDA